MRLEIVLTVVFIVGVDIVNESCQRHLGVDDELAALVEVENHVGPHDGALLRAHRLARGILYHSLSVVVDALRQSL